MKTQNLFTLSGPKGEFFEPPQCADAISASGYELRPSFIAMVREQSFSGRISENPYHHLREFEQLCSFILVEGMTQNTLKWKLFPFSLSEEARQWYIRVVGYVNGSWIELQNRFYSAFFSLSRICALQM